MGVAVIDRHTHINSLSYRKESKAERYCCTCRRRPKYIYTRNKLYLSHVCLLCDDEGLTAAPTYLGNKYTRTELQQQLLGCDAAAGPLR
jgi:hypothetical protein